jgi:hypothetical protein
MTYFLNFRSENNGVTDPRLFTGVAGSTKLAPVLKSDSELFGNRDVVFVTHGFNVDAKKGINALDHFGDVLGAPAMELYVAVLWPGDWWMPLNYIWEADDAVDCGKRLAIYCGQHLKQARSISFISHSLGGRLMLEAVRRLDRKAKLLCLTAAAVDNNCLQKQYKAAADNCETIVNLASRKDRVLKYLYPAGDFVSDILGDDDSPFVGALGRAGPRAPVAPAVYPYQIRDDDKYDHGNYLPPATAALPDNGDEEKNMWRKPTRFMINAFRGLRQDWP